MTLSDLRRDDWSRFSLKQRLQRYGVLALTLLAIGWAVSSIEVIASRTSSSCSCSPWKAWSRTMDWSTSSR